MSTEDRNNQIARSKRQRLNQLETAYIKARDYVKTPAFTDDQIKCLQKIRKVMKMSKEPNEALFLMGRVWEILAETFAHEDIIVEYEQEKHTLEEMFPPS